MAEKALFPDYLAWLTAVAALGDAREETLRGGGRQARAMRGDVTRAAQGPEGSHPHPRRHPHLLPHHHRPLQDH
ncbi:MAG: hypothetical protein BIP78_1299 [Candidatus Bipolaricaulis sibiricus]|uniref:Uncharacterized protein n=1 Tax=Bipolaricaulis sibiricus TaxID=2501609 RepID=A0A410FVC6_BIPS1|nr:MAG: hypothetical protein BIP78_1299 [Candidatus Bipolaricaulis sibiricus]